MRARITGAIETPAARLSIDSADTWLLGTAIRCQARGVPSVSVITIGKSMFSVTSSTMFSSSGCRAAGNDACARKRASTRDVVVTSCDRRVIIFWVNRKTPTASTTLPVTSSVR